MSSGRIYFNLTLKLYLLFYLITIFLQSLFDQLIKHFCSGLEADLDKYDVISSGATKERDLYRNLLKMKREWYDIYFKTSTFKDTGIAILTALDDIQVVLDDHILKALTMRGSIFAKPFELEVKTFYEKLVRINRTIEQWGKVQSQWLYLLPIFSSKDIVAQMPEEGNLFKEVCKFIFITIPVSV